MRLVLPGPVDGLGGGLQATAEQLLAQPPLLGQETDRIPHEVGGVGPAAPALGRKVGRVSLHQEELIGQDGDGLAKEPVGRIGKRTRDRGVPAALGADGGQFRAAGEAVEHGALRGAVGLQHLHTGGVRVAVVDLQGQVEVLGQGDVRSEGLTLSGSALFTGAEEIQSALSDGDGDVGVRPERLLQAGDRGLDRLGVVLLRTRSKSVGAGLAHPGVEDGLVGVHGQGHAHAACVEVLEADGAPERTVFHCFSGGAELAAVCAERGWYASIAGPLTYPANGPLREAVADLPDELLLVETDAPYLPPKRWRGRPNASYLMGDTVRFLAEQRGLGEGEFCRRLQATTEVVYGSW